MKSFNHSCQGESHKKESNKECQDYSISYSDEIRGIHMAIVCDGHGGKTYFRSAVGARLAAEITKKKLLEVVSDNAAYASDLFCGAPFTQIGTVETVTGYSKFEEPMRHLFASIYEAWRLGIKQDGLRPLTEWEQEHVDPQYYGLLKDENQIVKAYGCTLMAFVCTPAFWFAFHLGDGKCVMLDKDGNISQPIPWDEKCFLNKTTSMCGSKPVDDFRYCIDGTGTFPMAMCLGSDGIDDTYGDGDALSGFYGDILKELHQEGLEATLADLQKSLPELSKRGSQDDMSVAIVYDENRLGAAVSAFASLQNKLQEEGRRELETKIEERSRRLAELTQKIAAAKSQLLPFNTQIASLTNSIQELQQKVVQANAEETRLKTLLQDILNIGSSSKSQLESKQQQLEEVKTSASRIERQIADYVSKMEKCQSEIERNKAELQSLCGNSTAQPEVSFEEPVLAPATESVESPYNVAEQVQIESTIQVEPTIQTESFGPEESTEQQQPQSESSFFEKTKGWLGIK